MQIGKLQKRLKDRPDGKYVNQTAISSTLYGEGKSTCAMGLVRGMGKRSKSVVGAIRQPSGGGSDQSDAGYDIKPGLSSG